MRILIDTNIFIYSEDDLIVDSKVAELNSLSQKHNIELTIHPASLDDLKRDKNLQRKTSSLSKIKKYPILEFDNKPNEQLLKKIGESNKSQDIVDNKILYAVYKNAVNSLVTEDIKIHKKARKLGLVDRVLTISQTVEYIKKLYDRYIPSNLILDHLEINKLNLKDTFFDSFRKDYPDFDDWFIENSRKGRKCWCWRDSDDDLKALLIHAEKNKKLLRNKKENVFKICSFKVGEEVRGLKLGELLLDMCFRYCYKNNLTSTYLTTFEKQTSLRILIEDFGFEHIDMKHTGEMIYAKDFSAPKNLGDMHPLEYCKKYYPYFFDGQQIQKFVVPIEPRYHDRLFADSKQKILSDYFLDIIPERNTIKKVYICKSNIQKIKNGDILLFYRSHHDQGITSIGVVEATLRSPSTFDELISFVGPRSVYSKDELKEYYDSSQKLAILFRYIGQLNKIIERKKLIKYGILKGPPQSIKSVDNISYLNSKEENNWQI